MKLTITLSMLFICVFPFSTSANIFRVNSSLATDASQKLYKTINEAVAAAGTGDTLMIEGSPVQYDNAKLSKPLVLIGPGYFLTQNPETQANGSSATVQGIDIQATASGSVLEGLTFASGYSGYTPQLEASKVIIMECYLPNPIIVNNTIDNIMILKNYFAGQPINVGYSGYGFTNTIFENNFVGGAINISSTNEYPRIFSSIQNNIFVGNVVLTSATFRSNILTNSSASVTVTSANIQNNLSVSTHWTGNGNQTVNPSQLFVATGSTDGQYKLQSTYLTAGYNGTQPGIFGGSEPYVLSGIPPVPSIYELNADNVANKQTGLSVEIKVKSNK